jgi:hypothetical protein
MKNFKTYAAFVNDSLNEGTVNMTNLKKDISKLTDMLQDEMMFGDPDTKAIVKLLKADKLEDAATEFLSSFADQDGGEGNLDWESWQGDVEDNFSEYVNESTLNEGKWKIGQVVKYTIPGTSNKTKSGKITDFETIEQRDGEMDFAIIDGMQIPFTNLSESILNEAFAEWEMSFEPMTISGVTLDPETVYKVKARSTVEAIKKASKEAGLSGNDWMATVTNKLEKIK